MDGIRFQTITTLLDWQAKQCGAATVSHRFSLHNCILLPHQVAYIVECRTGKVLEATPRFGKIFGYAQQELTDVQQLYEQITKADLPATLHHTHRILDWIFKNESVPPMEDGAEFCYNIRTKSGRIARLLRQTATCGKANGKVTHTLGILTDISHYDATRKSTVRALGPTACYFDESISAINNTRAFLSKRECEILLLVARGMTSKSIATALHISSHTVDKHRRNMLHKLEATNTPEMICLARELNLI